MTTRRALSNLAAARRLAACPGLSPAELRAARRDLDQALRDLARAEFFAALTAEYAGFSVHTGRGPAHA